MGHFDDMEADLVFSIDVTQHIVCEEKLSKFLKNMESSVHRGGHIVLTSYTGLGNRYTDPSTHNILFKILSLPKLRWVYAWDVPTIQKHLVNCKLIARAGFWDKTILAFEKIG